MPENQNTYSLNRQVDDILACFQTDNFLGYIKMCKHSNINFTLEKKSKSSMNFVIST